MKKKKRLEHTLLDHCYEVNDYRLYDRYMLTNLIGLILAAWSIFSLFVMYMIGEINPYSIFIAFVNIISLIGFIAIFIWHKKLKKRFNLLK